MKTKRTTDDIEQRLVACYEWKPVSQLPPVAEDNLLCVSLPTAGVKRTFAIWDGTHFKDWIGRVLVGVTYWCFLPSTPEDLLAEAAEAAAPPEPASDPQMTQTSAEANVAEKQAIGAGQ